MSFPLISVSQFFDSSGSPLTSGTIEFRDPTTNDLINSYPTADDADAQTNANSNHLTLNSRGEATSGLYLEDGVKYKIILKDSDGVTVWTQDDVRTPVYSAESIGITLYATTSAETSAGITPTNFQYEPGNVLRYGPNTTPGTTDMTTAIQAACDSNDVIVFKSGAYSVIGDTNSFTFPTNNALHAVAVSSDTTIILEAGVTIQIKLTTSGNYAAFGCYQKSNIHIFGPGQIVGDLDTHDAGGSGEQGFGIDVRDCDNVTIESVRTSKCWGDGLYIAAGDPATDSTRTTNCRVNNCHSFGNRRQAMSVVGVIDFEVNGGLFQTTTGTSPKAGIDFEPNSTQRNERVSVNGVGSTGNEIGLLFIQTDYFTVTGGTFDNTLRNLQFADSKGVVVGASLSGTPSQGHFYFNDETVRKDITVRGCDIYITTGTFLTNYPGAGSNTTGDQIFDGNTIHVAGAPDTSLLGGTSTTDCKQFINNTLIFDSTYALTNLTSNSFITAFQNGWQFSNNKTYNRSSNTVSYKVGSGITGTFGPMNFWIGPYSEAAALNGYLRDSSKDFGSIANGAQATSDDTITGAALGDKVEVTTETDLGNLDVSGRVQATNTVRTTVSNTSGGAIDPPDSAFRIKVTRHGTDGT